MSNDYINIPDDELRIDWPPRGIKMGQAFEGTTVIKMRMFSRTSFAVLGVTLFWNGIVSLFVCAAIIMTAEKFGWTLPDWLFKFEDDGGGGMPWWGLWLFLTPFIAIGVWFIWTTIFSFLGQCIIRISTSEMSVYTGIGMLGRTRRFAPKSVKSIGRDDEGSHPRIVIEMKNGREIKFPFFGKMRETWLAFALRKILNR